MLCHVSIHCAWFLSRLQEKRVRDGVSLLCSSNRHITYLWNHKEPVKTRMLISLRQTMLQFHRTELRGLQREPSLNVGVFQIAAFKSSSRELFFFTLRFHGADSSRCRLMSVWSSDQLSTGMVTGLHTTWGGIISCHASRRRGTGLAPLFCAVFLLVGVAVYKPWSIRLLFVSMSLAPILQSLTDDKWHKPHVPVSPFPSWTAGCADGGEQSHSPSPSHEAFQGDRKQDAQYNDVKPKVCYLRP